MMRVSSRAGRLLAVAAAVLAAGALLGVAAEDSKSAVAIPGGVDQEPVLMYEVAGYGIGGPLHERLTVYSNGVASYSAAGPFDSGSACFTVLDESVVDQLRMDLAQAGVFTLGDLALVGNDLPVTTVTVFRTLPDGWSRARTFSFMEPFGAHARVVQIVQALITSHIEGQCGPDTE